MSLPVFSMPVSNSGRLAVRISEHLKYQFCPDQLVRDTLRRKEGVLCDKGALVIRTGEFTGRSPKDRFIVKDDLVSEHIDWNEFNLPLEEKYFEIVLKKMTDYLNHLPELWVRDCYACADPRYRLNIRIINETPATNLFAYNMFIRPTEVELESFKSDWQVLSAPGLSLSAEECGVRQSNAVIISFKRKTILIAGTGYTGETKKGIFSILNYILPQERKVLSMHCSANIGKDGDTAIFFGLSGTGKTTLSADPERKLIGDDEHGWTDEKIFNFEGGCYAKCINLKEENEPEIYRAIRPGTLVENVSFYQGTDQINFSDGSITENTRISYPLNYISNVSVSSSGNHPKNIFFLTCDAYGVLPPISKLTTTQAMYQFISGYTAKVAGTETGIKDPKSTFSACFGAPFLPLHPGKYAEMLGRKMKEHQVKVWLVNTGWTGGPYLTGKRIRLADTRAMISAALSGRLEAVDYEIHPVFGMAVPKTCPGVPPELLNPRNTWSDKKDYDQKAIHLAGQFIRNFEKYKNGVSAEIWDGAPKI